MLRPVVSSRGLAMPASPIRRLMPLADDARRRGVHVYHLNIGQPDIETPLAMRQRLALVQKIVAYTPSGGTPEFVASLQEYYRRLGIELGANEIIATTGGSEAVSFAFFACAGHGDEALLVEPYYTNYNSFATLAGIRLVPLRTRGEDGFHLPPREAWEKALSPRTKMVVLCNPNNPTGTVYSRDEMLMVAQFCKDNGLFFLSDEVYRELAYDGNKTTSALTLPGFDDVVIVADSLSKRYSACGIRLGCLATRNRDVYQAVHRMAQGRLSAPGLAQLMAVGATELGPEYFDGIVEEYQGRRDVLYDGLKQIPGVFLRKPEGAFYFIAQLPIDDSDAFASYLLSDFERDKKTVMVAPAPGFYATPGLGKDEVRIAYVLKSDDLRDAVRLLGEAIPAFRAARGLGELAATTR
jgi:aspartate aminotransferase